MRSQFRSLVATIGARLTVLSTAFLSLIAASPLAQAVDCVTAPSGLIGWWPGDGSAADILGANPGTLQGGATANAPGFVGSSFEFDGTNAFVQIPDAPALRPGNLTVEAWVKFSSLDSPSVGGSPAGTQYIIFRQNTRSTEFEGFDLGKIRTASGDIFRFLISSASGQHIEARGTTTIATGVWYHIAAVRGSNFVQLFVNGALQGQTNITFPQSYGNFPLYFGTTGQPNWDHKLAGNLDEPSFYNRALSSNEIAAIYSAGPAAKCKAPVINIQPHGQVAYAGNSVNFGVAAGGYGPVSYQWLFDGIPLVNGPTVFGATSTNLQLNSVRLVNEGAYSLLVSNPFASVLSSNAQLVVDASWPGVPFVRTFTPPSAAAGSIINVLGFNFSPSPLNNIVFLGAVRATVIAANPTNLTVLVPPGATFAPITVTLNGFTGISRTPFQPTFPGDGSAIGPSSFVATGARLVTGAPIKTLIHDLDGDLKPDLAMASMYGQENAYGDTATVSHNDSSPGVLTPGSFSWSESLYFANYYGGEDLEIADVDGDGKPDLIIPDHVSNYVAIVRNISVPGRLPYGSFATEIKIPTGTRARTVRAGNIDGEGLMDIFTANFSSNSISILKHTGLPGNLPTSSFDPPYIMPVGINPIDIAIADLNGDGRPDLVVALLGEAKVAIVRNTFVHGFPPSTWFTIDTTLPTPAGPNQVAIGDVDGDGKLDLVIASIQGQAISVFRNLTPQGGVFSQGSFSSRTDFGTPGWAHNVKLTDLNGDNKPDIITVGELGNFLALFQNQSTPGTVAFASRVDYPTGSNAWGVDVGDLDGDGRPDIVYGNFYDHTQALYRNTTAFSGAPFIVTQPSNKSVPSGLSTAFSVVVGGQTPLSYRWNSIDGPLSDVGRISGAATPTLSFFPALTNDIGSYWLVVSNSAGAVTSSVVSLAVQAVPCVPPPAGLVAWWSGNGHSLDSGGTNPATLTSNVTYGPGLVGQAFAINGATDGVMVGNPASLRLQNFTIEAWIRRTNQFRVASDQFGRANIFGYWNDGYQFGIYDDGRPYLTREGYGGPVLDKGIADTNYHHVAVTKTGTNVVFYLDGEAFPVIAFPLYTVYTFNYYAEIGSRFLGLVDEVSVYDHALSTPEVQGIYRASTNGKCRLPPTFVKQPLDSFRPSGSNATFFALATGEPDIAYRWYFNGTPLSDDSRISGSATPALTVFSLQSGDAGTYWVTASNPVNSAVSSQATLTLGDPPVILQQPSNQTAIVGSVVTFSVTATGSPPLGYHWRYGGQNLPESDRIQGTTTPVLTYLNLAASDNGTLDVVISNNFGSVTSAPVVLKALVPPFVFGQPVGRSSPVGLPTIFTSSASGTAPLGYQWLLNGTNIPGATFAAYTNLSINPNTAGAYQLLVTNAAGAATSSVALLTIGPIAAWGQNTSGQSLPPAGLSNVISVAAGTGFSAALRANGTVAVWGGNPPTNVPPGLNDLVAISAGSFHMLALHANGTVVAWGLNNSGVTNVPSSLSNVVAISAGSSHGSALRADGTVVVWGSNTQGQTNQPPNLNLVQQIDAGIQTLALRPDGSVIGWGGAVGQAAVSTFPTPPPTLTNAIAVSSGPLHDLALTSQGTVVAWGGGGTATNVPPGLTNVLAVEAAGGSDQVNATSFAIRSNRTVVAWGASSGGISTVPPGVTNVVALSGSTNHMLALENEARPLILRPPVGGTFYVGRDLSLKATATGAQPLFYQWQRNGTNLPAATNTALLIPAAQLSDAGAYQLVVSNSLDSAISLPVPVTMVDGPPFFWLKPSASQRPFVGAAFSLGSSVGGSGPLSVQWQFNGQDIPSATNENFLSNSTRLTSMGLYSLSISNAFGATNASTVIAPISVLSWGSFDAIYGQTNVPLNLTNAIAVAAAFQESLALRSDGTVTAFGNSNFGITNVPANLSNVVEIAAGYTYHLALKTDGTVRAWGSVAASLSNALATLSNIVAVEVDLNGSSFLRTNGSVLRLNYDGSTNTLLNISGAVALGQFDDGVVALKSDCTLAFSGSGNPPPGNSSNVLSLAMLRNNGILVRRDGTTLNWGQPAPTTNRLTGIVAVGPNAAIRADGSITNWSGIDFQNPPTYLPSLRSVGAVDSGSSHSLALLVSRSFPAVILPDSLNTTALVVSSRNAPQWYGQSVVSHDGLHAAQSAEIGANTASSMRALVTGPVTVSFWWRVSSETNHDFLTFSIGGVPQSAISGESGWQQAAFNVPPGPQMIVWTYSKAATGTAGADAAWVDQLNFIPHPPTILSLTPSQTVAGGGAFSVLVSATGTPPLAYKWFKGGNPLSGATSPGIFFNPLTRSNSGTYSVIVTNSAGTTNSGDSVLRVLVPQQFQGSPAISNGILTLVSGDSDTGLLSPADLPNFTAFTSSNLINWLPLPNSLSISNGLLYLRDVNQAQFPTRFYRIEEH